MTWSWPGPPSLGYALTTVGMVLFWTMVIFGAIVLLHHLGRENLPAGPPATGRPGPPGRPRPADTAVVVQIRIPTKTITPVAGAAKADETSRPDVAVAPEDVLVPLHRGRRM